MMPTLQGLAERFGCGDLAAAFPEIDIPLLTGAQRQGDVLVLPSTLPRTLPHFDRWQSLERGVVVVDSLESDHTHTLHGLGVVRRLSPYYPADNGTVAWLTVPEDGEAFLMHSDEHGALGIGPGVYEIRQQMEYWPRSGWRPVED